MAERSQKKLGRLLRVRTLQLGQVQADETRAHARVAQEAALSARIAQLSADVAPAPTPAPGHAISMIAAAHYRERLQHSAAQVEARLASAEQGLEEARAATREARRDQSAIEKLIERARAEAARKAMRALEELPPSAKKRHGPC